MSQQFGESSACRSRHMTTPPVLEHWAVSTVGKCTFDGLLVRTLCRNRRSATLAVDFLGASRRAIQGMSEAALAFCQELAAAHPGTKIAASTVARLPL